MADWSDHSDGGSEEDGFIMFTTGAPPPQSGDSRGCSPDSRQGYHSPMDDDDTPSSPDQGPVPGSSSVHSIVSFIAEERSRESAAQKLVSEGTPNIITA